MSKKTRFLFNGILLTLVGLAMRGAGVFLGAHISSAIGAEGIGLQGLVATVYSFAITLATSGVSLSVTRLAAEAAGKGIGDRRVMRGAFLYAFFFGAATSILLFLLADVLGAAVLSDARTVGALKILAFSLLPIAWSAVISGYFIAVRRVALNAAVQVFGQILRIALTVVLLTRAASDTEMAIQLLAIGATVTEIVCFLIALIEYVIDRRIHTNMEKSGDGIREVAQMALPLAFSAYVRAFLLSVEHSLIPQRLVDRGNSRAEALSAYGYLGGMALPIILFPMTPLGSFAGLLVPEFAECEGANDRERIERMAAIAIERALVYTAVVAVTVFTFSEELGYVIYHTYEAGRYICILAPVIPIMYLDHVADSMLKGIGEHVYSMWVNIADSLLSVMLVWVLIPLFDIEGYAIVIILMELFNFALSYMRLKKRISFKVNIFKAFILPLVFTIFGAACAKFVFKFSGRAVSALWLILKIVFSLCIYLAISSLVNILTCCTKGKCKFTK